MSFFIKLNQQELGAIFGMKHAEVLAYLYIKQNSLFSEGKTKKICFGGLAGMLKISLKKEVTRTDATRLINALIKKELLSTTTEKQVYKLNFIENFDNVSEKNDTEIDTITKHNITIHNKTSSLRSANAHEKDEGFLENKEKTVVNCIKAATPPQIESEGGRGQLSTEAALIKQKAIENGWKWASNPKSLPIYEKAAEASKKKGQDLSKLLEMFNAETEDKTAMAFKIWIENLKISNKRKGPPVGEMVL